MSWQLSDKFSSSYINDYNLLNNKLVGSKPCNVDKYTTCLISPEVIMETASLVTNNRVNSAVQKQCPGVHIIFECPP